MSRYCSSFLADTSRGSLVLAWSSLLALATFLAIHRKDVDFPIPASDVSTCVPSTFSTSLSSQSGTLLLMWDRVSRLVKSEAGTFLPPEVLPFHFLEFVLSHVLPEFDFPVHESQWGVVHL